MSYSANGFSPRMRMQVDWGRRLRPEHKFPYSIELPRHPDHPWDKTNGDPRKVWLYDCGIMGQWSVEDATSSYSIVPGSGRTYYFENEQDLLIFTLRWQNEQLPS